MGCSQIGRVATVVVSVAAAVVVVVVVVSVVAVVVVVEVVEAAVVVVVVVASAASVVPVAPALVAAAVELLNVGVTVQDLGVPSSLTNVVSQPHGCCGRLSARRKSGCVRNAQSAAQSRATHAKSRQIHSTSAHCIDFDSNTANSAFNSAVTEIHSAEDGSAARKQLTLQHNTKDAERVGQLKRTPSVSVAQTSTAHGGVSSGHDDVFGHVGTGIGIGTLKSGSVKPNWPHAVSTKVAKSNAAKTVVIDGRSENCPVLCGINAEYGTIFRTTIDDHRFRCVAFGDFC
eukprot:TRINITY_DN345_c0_g1_i4.p1 TRINITY_DN345_c0_g1~~TRINITY_DN345_c0_g1_i4.p1  ORF type:complete len:287 (-),score=28.56 TRINITY_DN345_c0_g1_i4:357-1217(-)